MKSKYYSKYGSCSDVYYADSSLERRQPTEKQKKFLARLSALCTENGLSAKVGHTLSNRIEYSKAIEILVLRLHNAGVEVKDYG